MRLEGSCQCGRVRYSVESDTPYPYQFCFCSICRKTTGGAFGCNIMAKRATLEIVGRRFLRRYHAVVRNETQSHKSDGWRVFCGSCGTHLWLEDKRWPDGVWPNAGAIDTRLPVPPSYAFIMTRFKPDWVPWPEVPRAQVFREYPKQSIAEWHRRRRVRG